MVDKTKNILVIAEHKKIEALRMATGLMLLDDPVRVAVLGELPISEDTDLQLESLEFAEVPVHHFNGAEERDVQRLGEALTEADVVYVV